MKERHPFGVAKSFCLSERGFPIDQKIVSIGTEQLKADVVRIEWCQNRAQTLQSFLAEYWLLIGPFCITAR
jgi:hypothetical protein